ncbi:hypothetical protein [Candidatus Palauibacter sp.]|uniref:hypothetical protein n=1 Tax=Candidatus Palauibacter sp. TaxID=3101350 RepID=UPI003B5AEEC2
MRSVGWSICAGPEARQCVVVLAATPRSWKGRGAPSTRALNEARALVGSARRGIVVLLGHARWLETLGAPAICAWSTETVMERAAAAWLRAGTGP